MGEKGERAAGTRVTHRRANKRGKSAFEVNSVQRRRWKTKRGKDVPSAVDALPSTGRLLRLFRKSQQSSTARVSHNGS